ncbi:Protein of unknown function [Desulfuromusa kysingii]|uniref:DUF3108 domain-containing protein n=1 Tax=Desulfuromusa kysingii TaxID=37625 RepID=A0A1H3YR18_9BACT|nr:DUF3108 domain-containing protein [Desulfuromusa kysingii]SEA13930.1 Protein of unknown function [Desulfuromusa kysingii]
MKNLAKMSLFWLLLLMLPTFSYSSDVPTHHPVDSLLGEHFVYDISFLWFDHLAEGSIQLTQGDQPGTYLVVMQAKTLGAAAFFTRHRIEKYQTLMKIGPSGLLRPLWHSSHTIRGQGESRSEKITKKTFDYVSGRVRYEKIKNHKTYTDQFFTMDKGQPLYDILSALYNLRLGFYGQPGEETIHIPTFHRKGTQDIVVEPLRGLTSRDLKYFSRDSIRGRVLVDPSVFGTKGRDIFVSFDAKMRPDKGIIKDVIGLGDVRGKLRTRVN